MDRRSQDRAQTWSGYLLGTAIVAASTAAASFSFDRADAVMLYLLGVVMAALRLGRGPSLYTALLSVLVFDFVFIPPFLGFVMSDVRHLVTFGVMLLVALVLSRLTRRVREQAEEARERERRTAALYQLSRDLAARVDRQAVVAAAAGHLAAEFEAGVVVFGEEEEGGGPREVHRAGPAAAAGTPDGLVLPLATSRGVFGRVAVYPSAAGRLRLAVPQERQLLDAFVAHLALALERQVVLEEAERARLASEQEKLRNALLSSVSHDLRTPLGAIEGAASTLLALGASLDEPTRREMLETVHEEAGRLGRRVSNLLDMSRVEAGGLTLGREWQPLEEVVGAALAELDDVLRGREVRTSWPADLPPVHIDAVLVGQVLVNLLENAHKYSPPGEPLEISARHEGGEVVVTLADRGPGLRAGDEERVFERFYRSPADARASGVGLGLAICRAIVNAHGGRIWAEPPVDQGARIAFSLPAAGPAVPARPEEQAS